MLFASCQPKLTAVPPYAESCQLLEQEAEDEKRADEELQAEQTAIAEALVRPAALGSAGRQGSVQHVAHSALPLSDPGAF